MKLLEEQMKTRLNLKRGQKGTEQLIEKYGKFLLHARYRYDESRGVRLKTVDCSRWKALEAFHTIPG